MINSSYFPDTTLVHGGADLRAMDGTWKATPLQWAEYNGRSKAVSLLASFTR